MTRLTALNIAEKIRLGLISGETVASMYSDDEIFLIGDALTTLEDGDYERRQKQTD